MERSRSRSRLGAAGLAVVAGLAMVAALGVPTTAEAFNQTCGTPNVGPHCYSVSQSVNTSAYAAVELLQTQSYMNAGASDLHNQYFMTSEAWLCQNDSCDRWAEIGFLNGYVPVYNAGAYVVFVGYWDSAGYFHLSYKNAMGTPNGAGHQFRIGRGPTTYNVRAYFDYAETGSWTSSFWAGSYSFFGGEAAIKTPPDPTNNPNAHTFHMNEAVQTLNGAWTPMTQYAVRVHSGMNGARYSPGEWSWNAP